MADVRRHRFDLHASAGVTERLTFTPTEPIVSLAVAVGGTVTDVDDLTGTTTYPATYEAGDWSVEVPIPTGSSVPLRLVVNGGVLAVGRLTPSTSGAKQPAERTFTINAEGVQFTLEVGGPTGPPGGMFFLDAEGYVTAVVPSQDDSLTIDDDGFVLLTIGD